MPRLAGRVVAWLAVAAVVAARVALAADGTLQSPARSWPANVVVAAVVLAVTAATIRPAAGSDRLGRLAVVLALPAAAVAAAQLLAPSGTPEAIERACRGAAVAGGSYLAVTGASGVNARSGPSTVHRQTARFGGGCSLSFDAYCLGEPVRDPDVPAYADQRWFVLHQDRFAGDRFQLVAAGKVRTQSADIKLGRRASPRCAEHGGWTAPSPIKLRAVYKERQVGVHVRVEHALYVGIAVRTDRAFDGADNPFAITSAPKPVRNGRVAAIWNASLTEQQTDGSPTKMTLLVAPCLAAGVPQLDNEQHVTYSWDGERSRRVAPAVLDGDAREAMAIAACRLVPDFPKPVAGQP